MKCEYCGSTHTGEYGSGRFCCEKCARSYSTHNSDNITLVKDVECPRCKKKHKIRKRASSKQTLCNTCRKNKYKKGYDSRIGFCFYCGKKLKGSSKLYCSTTCHCEYDYLIFINRWKLGLDNGRRGKLGVSTHIKRYLFDKYNSSCQECGWSKKHRITNRIPLTIHHIDGDYRNNKEENLELLCPNCHALTDNFGSLNRNCTKENVGTKRKTY